MIATIPIILIVLAAFFKAVADTLTHHFDTSVFNWWDRRFGMHRYRGDMPTTSNVYQVPIRWLAPGE
jgi:hypothetical protein